MPPIIKILRDHRFDRISRKGLTARQYDPTIARFTSPDPLNGNYSHLSPYLYCAANPKNLSDPSGLAVIYDYNGDFLGHTSEGFTGQIYIAYSTDKIDFTSYTENQLLDSDSFVINSYDVVGSGLTIDAQSAILNNIISHFNGSYIYFEKFEMSKIDGGGIIFLEAAKKNSFNWRTELQYRGKEIVGKPVIYGNGNFLNDYEATVENIASSVIVHEWYSHGVKHFLDENKVMDLIYAILYKIYNDYYNPIQTIKTPDWIVEEFNYDYYEPYTVEE